MGFIVNFNISDYDKSQEKVRQTAGHDALGEFAPEFAHLNDNILLERYGVVTICFRFVTALS